MKVLIPNHFPLEGSGSGIYTQNVARELVEQGHEALVITPSLDQQEGYPFPVRSILFSPDEGEAESNGRLPFNFPYRFGFAHHRLPMRISRVRHLCLTHSACNVVLGELFAGASEDFRRFVKFHQLAQPE